jgi:DNA polymerase-3 subunit alpha
MQSSVDANDFVHLHLHSQYSLLEGAIPIESLVKRVQALGMRSVALTDSHNLFGTIDFYTEAKKAGLQPIVGCELAFAPGGRGSVFASMAVGSGGRPTAQSLTHPNGSPKVYHIVVLCKNLQGYQNLCQMITQSYLQAAQGIGQKGVVSGPKTAIVDRELLNQFGEGLIVLSGCLRGEIPAKVWFKDEEGALESLHWFKNRFGEDFLLELQDNGLPEQDYVNEVLSQWGEKFNIRCVATADCHYLDPEDAEAHEVLQCIEHGRNLDFDRPKSLVPSEYYIKSPQLMRERFERFPGAFENARWVADRCRLDFKFKDEQGRPIYHLPNFRPQGVERDQEFDLLEYFKKEAWEGLCQRFTQPSFQEKVSSPQWPELKIEYEKRLESELEMIIRTGFSGYFLIVADFIKWAKRNGIPVGPGRGSGAGSLVAYSLMITDIDPIEFKLLFERFINPERISMPDFDVDFCQDRRGEVIEYVGQKYGAENVCQIITFGKLQARAVIKDVGRVLGLSFADSDLITKMLPDELEITVSAALEKEPRIKERMEQDPRIAKVIEYALKLEGLYRSAGMHAAGVIITEKPVVTYCPLYVGKDGAVVTQFDKDFAEKIGLIKFDFLGLKTLTVIDNAVQLIRSVAEPGSADADFDLETINFKDPAVFALIGSGDTDGVFQIESSGMKDLCMRILPNNLEDITAINALYRPGPLGSGMVDDFIDRKHGRKPIVYDVPMLEGILKDTYGVILYQEQVMQIARELAGYSLGQADLLRRAMGKKKAEEMAEHRAIFVKGAVENQLPAQKAEAIFDLMAKFAQYGFNKSHSAAYGVITYQTAYLKTHYPSEFMAALMTTEMDNTDKITKYISDARAHQIAVLSPDVNRSSRKFSVERVGNRKAIRFGLEGIKGVGGVAVDAILEARAQAPFQSVVDLTKRVSTRKLNKKVLESLTLAGALDGIAEVNRASLFASLEELLKSAGDEQEEREMGQSSLFDAFDAKEIKLLTPTEMLFKKEADWPNAKKLALEKQVVGFYVSGHPMDPWQKICETWLGWTTEKIKAYSQEKASQKKATPSDPGPGGGQWGGEFPGKFVRAPKPEARLCGLLTEYREVTTKKGTRMAFAQIEDLYGKLEVVFFPEAYAQVQDQIKKMVTEAEPVVIYGEMDLGDELPKLLVKSVAWVEEAHKSRVQNVIIQLNPDAVSSEQLRELKKRILAHRGRCRVRIDFIHPQFKTQLDLPKNVGVEATPELVRDLNKIFGAEVTQLV